MRAPLLALGLVLLPSVVFPTPASSRGFAWFLAHSTAEGSCSGQRVVATYYDSGHRTASGQVFNAAAYTAAHRTLPFGSRVTVTNPANGRSVVVEINDRGPFTSGVTLDLARGECDRHASNAMGVHALIWRCRTS